MIVPQNNLQLCHFRIMSGVEPTLSGDTIHANNYTAAPLH